MINTERSRNYTQYSNQSNLVHVEIDFIFSNEYVLNIY